MNSIIAQLDDVHLIYHEPRGETEAVGGISLSVHKGEFVSIVGPSGCGKTSLLSIFAGILQPSSGKAEVLGAPPDPRANSTGYMLQRDHLFDWRTIEQNALLGLEVKKRLNAETHAYAAELLDRYGLGAFKDYYPRPAFGRNEAESRTYTHACFFAGAAAAGRTFFRIGLSAKASACG